jgi:4-amino-4-deoxy-L-arabinose transferase-like glycosyltransferase
VSAASAASPIGTANAASVARVRSGVRRALRRVPRAAWACMLVALANGLAWSLIVPPFQVPDENAHYAYVQQVAERGTLPRQLAPGSGLSQREDRTIDALLTFGIVGHRENPAPETEAQQLVIDQIGRENLPAKGSGDALSATPNPPLYYALEAIPYKLVPSGKVLDKLAAMRCLSALMGALTVLLVFMFLRELLPGTPWAWPAGALLVAFQPLFGFISGGVNNDDLLYLAGAGLLWALARAFRRGLTPLNGALIGGLLAVGLVTKFTMLGLVPAAALAVLLLVWRAWRSDRRRALLGACWALGLAAAPVLLYVVLNRFVWSRSALPGGVGSVPGAGGRTFNLHEEFTHVWQLFLPHLWMNAQFRYSPFWETWFKGFVGRFGWLDYDFPAWVYEVAKYVSLLVCALALGELVKSRDALRRRLGELSVYVLALLGVCVAIGVQSYRFLVANGGVFEQARYLLPLLALYGAVIALAVRFGGRRWGPAIGAALVVLAIGHDLFAQAITIARYYG